MFDIDDFPMNHKLEYDNQRLVNIDLTYFLGIDEVDRLQLDMIRAMELLESNHLKK